MDRFFHRRSENRTRAEASREEARQAEGSVDEEKLGLFELWPGGSDNAAKLDTTLDIVAVHGLNGDPYGTWTEGNKFWLQDFLPSAIPEARIFTYGYNSGLAFTGSVSKVDDYARILLERLKAKRRGLEGTKRPIIFICHSLGGIVMKKALILAHERSDRYASISRDVFGVMFLGTPHRGADIAYWSTTLGAMANLVTLGNVRTRLLSDLEPKSRTLGNICSQFVERGKDLKIFTIYERVKIKGLPALVVDEHSAVMHLPNEVTIPIEADHRSMARFLTSSSEKYQTVFDALKELVDDASGIDQSYITNTRTSFMKNLKGVSVGAILHRLPSPHEGTCRWFTGHPFFREWLQPNACQTLWVWGRPGVGKTIMMKYINEYFRETFDARSVTQNVVALFFCDDKDSTRRGRGQLLRSLMEQILDQNPDLIRHLNDRDTDDYNSAVRREGVDQLSQTSINFLWRSLAAMFQRSRNIRFWIIIDAIDELEPSSRHDVLGEVCKIVQRDSSHRVKIIFSDRVGPHARAFKAEASVFELGNVDAADDVRRFIEDRTNDLCTEARIPHRTQQEIQETLVRLSEGVFLHASLAWANFYEGVTYWSSEVVVKRLKQVRAIPNDAVSYYCALLGRIPEDSKEKARRAFVWVLGSRRPLTVQELQHAIAINDDQKSWNDLVGKVAYNFGDQFEQLVGYLLRADMDGRVRLTHQTVKEILLSEPGTYSADNESVLSQYRVIESQIEGTLAKDCVTLLSFSNFGQTTLANNIKKFVKLAQENISVYDRLLQAEGKDVQSKQGTANAEAIKSSLQTDRYAILFYCATYWHAHCTSASTEPALTQALCRFLRTRQSHEFFLVPKALGISNLHHSNFWNSIEQSVRVPPLQLAMRIGDMPHVLKALIRAGEDINGQDSLGWTALHWAVAENRTDCVKLMMRNPEVNVNRTRNMDDGSLHIACQARAGVSVLESLLDHPYLNVNMRNAKGWTILHWALRHQDLSLATMMTCRHDIDIDLRDDQGSSYLDLCFFYGLSEDIALQIINHPRTNPEWFTISPGRNTTRYSEAIWVESQSYLLIARNWSWHRVENIILSKDPSQVLRPETDGISLLERYAYEGVKGRLVEILETLPPNVFEQSPEGNSLLHLVTQQDWEDVATILQRDYGLSNSYKDKRGRTMLHYAAEYQWDSISDLCRDKPPSWLNTRAEDGKTALHVAIEHRNAVACEVLLDLGANHLVRDSQGRMPIHLAAEHGHRFLLKLLLQMPEREYGRDKQGRTLLHFLVMWESQDIIQRYIVKHRPIIQVNDRLRRTPLHYAAMYSNVPAVMELLEHGADPYLKDAAGSTPLHHALVEGSVPIVKALLDHGAYLWELDGYRRNALQLAFRSRSLALIDYMLDLIDEQEERFKDDPRGRRSEFNLTQMVFHTDVFEQTALHRACFILEEPSAVDGMAVDIVDEGLGSETSQSRSQVLYSYIKDLRTMDADINARDKYGCTPLHVAVKNNNRQAVEALLSFPEIQHSMRDNYDCTPLDHSVVQEQIRMTDVLRVHHAKHSLDFREKLKPIYSALEEVDLQRYDPNQWALAVISAYDHAESRKWPWGQQYPNTSYDNPYMTDSYPPPPPASYPSYPSAHSQHANSKPYPPPPPESDFYYNSYAAPYPTPPGQDPYHRPYQAQHAPPPPRVAHTPPRTSANASTSPHPEESAYLRPHRPPPSPRRPSPGFRKGFSDLKNKLKKKANASNYD